MPGTTRPAVNWNGGLPAHPHMREPTRNRDVSGPSWPGAAGRSPIRGQPTDDLFLGHRAREQIALTVCTADGQGELTFGSGFDPLGHDIEVEGPSQPHDALHQLPLPERRRHRAREDPVELNDVERHLSQVAQRRVSGAEVIDRDPYTPATKPLEVLPDVLVVAEEKRLGDLQHQPVRR